jgi:hypothetical protein
MMFVGIGQNGQAAGGSEKVRGRNRVKTTIPEIAAVIVYSPRELVEEGPLGPAGWLRHLEVRVERGLACNQGRNALIGGGQGGSD